MTNQSKQEHTFTVDQHRSTQSKVPKGRDGEAARGPDGAGSSERDARNPPAALTETFAAATSVLILLNTSFRVMGQADLLHTAEDALLMLHTTSLEAIVVEDWLLTKVPA